MENFFPTSDYKVPTSSNYMKFMEGENTFRVLSSAIVGYEYWNTNQKPVRSKEEFEGIPDDIKMVKNERGESVPSPISHFWAFVVWNYNDKRIQILEVKQKGIMQTMQTYIKNPKWGSPKEYDFIVNRVGSGFDSTYSVAVNPKAPLEKSIEEMYAARSINLNALYEDKDPFKGQ